MKVKVCGITDTAMADFAVRQGADYIGLVFHPASVRHVSLEQAQKISATTVQAGAEPVAVFVDQTAVEIIDICAATGISIAQLHGKISREQVAFLPEGIRRIYVCSINDQGQVQENDLQSLSSLIVDRDFVLFDGMQAGSGQRFDWQHFNYTGSLPWFLSGGLSPNNINEAIEKFHPYGVDVSSGVESVPGKKDKDLIRRFIEFAG